MIALLNKVALPVDPMPGEWNVHTPAFRDPSRGRYLRLGDARRAHLGRIKEEKENALYYETFFQLLQFRGIDVEALP